MSPSNGFITIYIDYTKMAQKLLPYSVNIDAAAFKVKSLRNIISFRKLTIIKMKYMTLNYLPPQPWSKTE